MTCVLAGGYSQASLAQQAKSSNLTQFVNPRIGTGGHGHVFLGANVPFGYVQLGPTEPSRGWDWCSGYHHSDSILIGFGHQHLSGTGIGDLGDVAFLPVTDGNQKEIKFSHDNENVRPGYYAVKLQQPNVWVELTATQRAGFQRYTFGADAQQAQLVLDLKQGIGWDAAKDFNVDNTTEPSRGWDWCSGYHHSDSILIGFGHQHLSGTGIGDLGDVAFLPVTDGNQKEIKFSHDNENVRPGYYAVKLQQPNVWVELTATQRAGFQRYTFGADAQQAQLVLDLKQGIGWDAAKDFNVDNTTATTVAGHRFSKGWANDQKAFFFAEFSQPVTVKPLGAGRWLITAADVTKPLLVKTGLSAVSAENAKLNLEKEIPGWDFRQVVADADAAWNKELAKVNIETSDSTSRRIFYTAMYHTMTAPSVFSDVNGQYRGADGKVYDGNFTNYTTLSLWDTYRAAHPLMTMIHTDMLPDMASTFINIYRQQGKLPVWHLMGNETNCMVGNPGIPVLADMVLKGYVKDKEGAYEAMKKSAMLDERGLGLLKKHGYLPYDKEPTKETVAKGMEYALADACVAKVARMLGKKEDAKYFENRSKAYSKYFDKETGFMRGLGSDGKFRVPFNPFAAEHREDDYTEGNAWQYTWLVPHDVHGLVKLFGNEKKFVTKLDSLFIVTGEMGDNASPDISGLIGQYAHGNEPSHHVLYMYNYVGQPWKAARLLRQTLDEMYKDDFDGLSGNEDVGQMSAWYVLSSVGLYQVEPAGGKYIIGSPIFDKAELNVGKGKTFNIVCKNNSKENMYVQSVKLNGKPYNKSYIMYNDIMKGGTLELQMGNQPSKWGTRPADRP